MAAWCWALLALAQMPDDFLAVELEVHGPSVKALATADRAAEAGKWEEAVDLLQTLAETPGDRVAVADEAKPNRHLPIRTLALQRLCELPPEALRLHRGMIDGRAGLLFKEWQATGTLAALRKLAHDHPAATMAPTAFDKLGDQLLAEGDPAAAAVAWGTILPAALAGPRLLRPPGPPADPPRVAAKFAAAKLLAGDRAGAERVAAWLLKEHPQAGGKFAGREGTYAAAVTALLAAADFRAPPPAREWHEFGGGPARTRVAPELPDIGELEHALAPDHAREPEEAGFERERQFPHALAIGDVVLAPTATNIVKYDLAKGLASTFAELGDGGIGQAGAANASLALAGGTVYAVWQEKQEQLPLNGMRMRGRGRGLIRIPRSTLFAFTLAGGNPLWRRSAEDLFGNGGDNTMIESAPVAAGGRLLLPLVRYDATAQALVACVDPATQTVLWKTTLCSAALDLQRVKPPFGNMLALADGQVFACTNLGVVAALDAETGAVRWAVKYPRRPTDASGLGDAYRSMSSLPPNPVVVAGGVALAAPHDSDRVMAFDAATGALRWSVPARQTQALMAAGGLALVCGRQVRAFDLATGKARWEQPQFDGAFQSAGLPMVAGGQVVWPTGSDLHFFRLEDGAPTRAAMPFLERFGAPPGVLLPAGERVLSINGNPPRLRALGSSRRRLEQRQREVAERPAAARPHLELARVAVRMADLPLADRHFAEAVRLAQPDQAEAARPLAALARAERFAAALLAAQGAPVGDRPAAFAAARKLAPDADAEVAAFAAEARIAPPARALAAWHELLAKPELRGRPAPEGFGAAGTWAVGQALKLRTEHAEAAAALDAQAARQFAELKDLAPDALAELARRYPGCPAALAALDAEAQRLTAAGQHANAAALRGAAALDVGAPPAAFVRWADALRQAGRTDSARWAEAAAARRDPAVPWPKSGADADPPVDLEVRDGAFRRRDGKGQTLWSLAAEDAPRGWRGATATAAEARWARCGPVAALALADAVVGVELDSGAIRWRRPWTAEATLPRLTAFPGVLCIAGERRFAAVDPFSGATLFEGPLGDGGGAAAGFGDALAHCPDRVSVEVRSARDGKLRWRRAVQAPTFRPPQLLGADDLLLVALDGFQTMACSSTGEVLWQVATAELPRADAAWAVGADRWAALAGPRLECRNLSDGALVWRQLLGHGFEAPELRFRGAALAVADAERTVVFDQRGACLPAE